MKGKHFGRRLLAAATLLAVLCAAMPSALATEAGYGLMDTFQDYYAQVEADDETPVDPEEPVEEPAEDETKMPAKDEKRADGVAVYAANTVQTAYYYRDSDSNTWAFYEDADHTKKIADTDNITMQKFLGDYCAANAEIYVDSTYYVTTAETWSGSYTLKYHVAGNDEMMISIGGGTGAGLTLDGQIVLDGDNKSVNCQYGIIYANGSITINKATIQNFINKGGYVICSVGYNGIRLSGTSITHNEGRDGILVANDAYQYNGILIDLGTVISENTVTGDDAATVETQMQFFMSGGKIEKNTVGSAAVKVTNGDLFMNGGTIRDNKKSGGELSDLSLSNLNSCDVMGGNMGYLSSAEGMDFSQRKIDLNACFSGAVITKETNVSDAQLWCVDSEGQVHFVPHAGTEMYPDENGCIYLETKQSGASYYDDARNVYPLSATIGDETKTFYEVAIQGGTADGNAYQKIPLTASFQQVDDYAECVLKDDIGKPDTASILFDWGYTESKTDEPWMDDEDYGRLVWNAIISSTNESYVPGSDVTGKYIWVRLTGNESYQLAYGGPLLVGDVPQLSITVPTTLLVNVKANGQCEVTGSGSKRFDNVSTYAADDLTSTGNGTIKNNSPIAIYLTGVTFTWNTNAETASDGETSLKPDEIFTNWDANNFDSRPEMTLAVGSGNKATEGTSDGTDSVKWTPNAEIAAATGDDSPGTLEMTWSFELNKNTISQALQAGVAAPIGVITYTVSYEKPAA